MARDSRMYEFYVDDDRQEGPVLTIRSARSEAHARRIAEGLLEEPHHRGVEVWQGGQLLFGLGSLGYGAPEAESEARHELRRKPDKPN